MARSGTADAAASDTAANVVRSALRYVQQFNAHALLAGAQAAATEAWVHVVEVAFTRTYEQLGQVLPNGPAERLLEVLLAALEVGRGFDT